MALAAIAYLLVVGEAAADRHRYFSSSAYDLGIYDQALWQMSRGDIPYNTVRGLHILGDHFTPILYPLSLLYLFGDGTLNLLWLQSIALAAGAWPLYRMAVRGSGQAVVGVVAAVAYLLYPPLRGVNLFDFHPIAFATPALLFAFDFAFERNAVPFAVACCITALTKQEACIVAGLLAVWYAVRWRQPKSLVLTLGCFVWLVAALRIQAAFAGTSETSYVELYSRFGENTGEIIRTFLMTPWVPITSLPPGETTAYLLILIAPLALIPLRSPGVLWLLAVPLALNLFSNRVVMRGINYQYTALLTPVLFAAAISELSRMRVRQDRAVATGAWAVCAIVSALVIFPRSDSFLVRQRVSDESAQEISKVLDTIPADASVAATQNLVPHLARRTRIYMFPNPLIPLATGPGRMALRQQLGMDHPPLDREQLQRRIAMSPVEYMVIGHRLNRINGEFPFREGKDLPVIAELLRSPAYGVIESREGVWVLQRGADRDAGLRRLGIDPQVSADKFPQRVEDAILRDRSERQVSARVL